MDGVAAGGAASSPPPWTAKPGKPRKHIRYRSSERPERFARLHLIELLTGSHPYYFPEPLTLSPGAGALVMIPAGVAVAVLSPVIGRLADRIGTRTPVLAGLVAMALFARFLSTFAARTSVIPAGIGILGLSVGSIFVITPIISAAASALPTDQVGVGLGILQGAQFLGAGTGPALFGVLVTARQHSGSGAINSLYTGHEGAAFSDAFLAMAVVAVLASIVAFRM